MITFPHVAAVVVATVACGFDLRTRRIPNVLTLSAAALAVVFHSLASGWNGALFSAFGLVLGLAIFFPLFILRGMGAGDVKLLGALGAWLGPVNILWTAMYGGIAGGILAVAVAVVHRYLWRALSNIWGLFLYWGAVGMKPMPALTLGNAPGPRLAYAIPIAVGTAVTLWLRS